MKKFIAFAFLASVVVGSVGCKSDGNGYWCMKNPFYRAPKCPQTCYSPVMEVPCVDSCCGMSSVGYGGMPSTGCDSCATPSFSDGQIVDPGPTF